MQRFFGFPKTLFKLGDYYYYVLGVIDDNDVGVGLIVMMLLMLFVIRLIS